MKRQYSKKYGKELGASLLMAAGFIFGLGVVATASFKISSLNRDAHHLQVSLDSALTRTLFRLNEDEATLTADIKALAIKNAAQQNLVLKPENMEVRFDHSAVGKIIRVEVLGKLERELQFLGKLGGLADNFSITRISAIARPTKIKNVYFIVDNSGSLRETIKDPVTGAPLIDPATGEAITRFQKVADVLEYAIRHVQAIMPEAKIGVTSFSSSAYEIVPLQVGLDPAAARQAYINARAAGSTNMQSGITVASNVLNAAGTQSEQNQIVFITDGEPTSHDLSAIDTEELAKARACASSFPQVYRDQVAARRDFMMNTYYHNYHPGDGWYEYYADDLENQMWGGAYAAVKAAVEAFQQNGTSIAALGIGASIGNTILNELANGQATIPCLNPLTKESCVNPETQEIKATCQKAQDQRANGATGVAQTAPDNAYLEGYIDSLLRHLEAVRDEPELFS